MEVTTPRESTVSTGGTQLIGRQQPPQLPCTPLSCTAWLVPTDRLQGSGAHGVMSLSNPILQALEAAVKFYRKEERMLTRLRWK